MTPTQIKVLAWQAKQPGFSGQHTTAIGGKGARQTAKAKLVRKAAGR